MQKKTLGKSSLTKCYYYAMQMGLIYRENGFTVAGNLF